MHEADEILLGVIWQICGEEDTGYIDNMGMSAYEEATAYLHKIGLIDKINEIAYKIKKVDTMENSWASTHDELQEEY